MGSSPNRCGNASDLIARAFRAAGFAMVCVVACFVAISAGASPNAGVSANAVGTVEGHAAAKLPAGVPALALYRDPKARIADRVADLLGRMTQAEKVAQVQSVAWDASRLEDARTHMFSAQAAGRSIPNGIGALRGPGNRRDAAAAVAFVNALQTFLVERTRLGIPAIIHEGGVHGLVAPGATSFPQAIALAATFDPALVESVFSTVARQARARGVQQILAPVLDVSREPRWGGIEQTFGEDPHLVARMGVAAIRGLQGPRRGAEVAFDGEHVMASAMHFADSGSPEGGRNGAPGNHSAHVVREVYLPPFEAAVREANVASVVVGRGEIDGVPSPANAWLLRDLLRGEWGFKGLVVSDDFAVADLERRHHVVADVREAGRVALAAGVDVEFPEADGYRTLAADIAAGKLPQATLDQAVGRVLRAKLALGLFEHPYTATANPALPSPPTGSGGAPAAPAPAPARAPAPVASDLLERPAERLLARRAAEEAIVLLKNDGGVLPLEAARLRSIAVIGPNAAVCRLGGASGAPDGVVSVLDGITARVGGSVKVLSAPGCGLTRASRGPSDDAVELSDPAEDARLIAAAARLAAAADVTVLVLGENDQLSREAWTDNRRGDRMTLDLVGKQMELARAVLATRRATILVLIHGGPLSVPELARSVPAVLDGFYLGEETGTAVAEVLFGQVSPAGRLPVSIPRAVGAIPAYHDYKPSARRPYLFEDPGPLWPFGHGLSYTTFEYEGLAVKPGRIGPDGHATVSVTVKNTGSRASDEVVQLYIHDLVSSTTRPVQELRGFQRIHLAAGASRRVEMPIGPDALSFLDRAMKPVVEPGRFEILVGGSSDPSTLLHANLDVVLGK